MFLEKTCCENLRQSRLPSITSHRCHVRCYQFVLWRNSLLHHNMSLDLFFNRSPVSTEQGVSNFLSKEQTAAVRKCRVAESRFKDFFKRWPRLYEALFAMIGPSLLTGVSSKRFVQQLPAGSRVLSAGSGTRRLSASTVNVDLFAFNGVNVVADLSDLPFHTNVFDAVTCEQVLEHVQHPLAVVAELYRVVKPGGLIHVASPFLFPWHASPSDYTRWTQEGLRSLFPNCTVQQEGIMAGPFSALNAFLPAFLATLFCFGSVRLQSILQWMILIPCAPIKLLDIVFARMPGAKLCAANFFLIVRKSDAV